MKMVDEDADYGNGPESVDRRNSPMLIIHLNPDVPRQSEFRLCRVIPTGLLSFQSRQRQPRMKNMNSNCRFIRIQVGRP